jgi:prefoldin subunit 5
MSGLAELAAEVEALRAELAEVREALQHVRAIAEHERRARELAVERVQHAWRVVTPRRSSRRMIAT